jgi:4-hydroxy-2-oxoheptanedioate aldolase
MRKNLVKEKLRRGEPSIGTWVSTGDPLAAEILAHAGFDWLSVDMEHNAIDMRDLLHCFYAITTTETVPFVRVPWNDPQILKRVLDIGSYGVVVPNVKSLEEAELAVQACRYAPDGFRGVGSIRGRLFGGPDYQEMANEEIVVVLMIEDTEAVRRIAEICDVPGVDVLFIGPNDLASSLGVPGGYDNPHPDHKAAVRQVLETGKRFNIPVGIHCGSAEEVNRRIEEGFLWMPILSDARFLAAAAQDALQQVKLPGALS